VTQYSGGDGKVEFDDTKMAKNLHYFTTGFTCEQIEFLGKAIFHKGRVVRAFKHNAMETYGTVEVKLNAFLTSGLDGVDQLHASTIFPLEKEAWYLLDRKLDGLQNQSRHSAEEKNPCSRRESNPRNPNRIHLLYYTILYYTILYYTILYYTTPHYTILHCTVLYFLTECHAMKA
jgi:hypothetical protein